MLSYKHRFESIEQYLHHRKPYLLVDKIQSITTNEIVSEKSVTGKEPFLKGHFPGAPVFPGAMMQELTTQTAGALIAAEHNPMKDYDTSDPFHNKYALGVLVKVKHARYKGFARPGDLMIATVVLDENVSNIFDFSASVSIDDKTIMLNSFQLTNIKSSVLQGAQTNAAK